MTKHSWTEGSWFPIFNRRVLLLKLDWNRSTEIAVDSNCWLEAQGQWSNAFWLPRSSKIALTSITSVLMIGPFSVNLAITWEIVSGMPKSSWQTGETEDLLFVLVLLCAGWLPAATLCRFHTPSISCFISRSWGWIPWGLRRFNAFNTQLNLSVGGMEGFIPLTLALIK